MIGKVATNRIRDDFNNEVRGAAQTLAAEIRIVYTPLGTAVQSPELNDFVRPDHASARVYDLSGNLIKHSAEAERPGPVSLGLSTFRGDRVATAEIRNEAGAATGFVQYGRSLEHVDSTVNGSGSSSRPASSAARCSPSSPGSRSPPGR